MTSIPATGSPSTAGALCGAVVARGVVRVAADGFAALKTKLLLPDKTPLATAQLKHSDEQTIAALAAVLTAIHQHKLTTTDLTDWAVLAAPRFLGRQALAHTLQRFAAEGAWGISPHVIPHRLLHAVSGTISLTLKIHGPNFGIDGMPGGTAQLLATALAVLSTGQVPGVWAVMTGWDPEPIPARAGAQAVNLDQRQPVCHAAALALVPLSEGWSGPCLRFHPPVACARGGNGRLGASEMSWPLFHLEALAEALEDDHRLLAGTSWRLTDGGCLEIVRADQP